MKKDRKLRAGENVFGWLMLALSLFLLVQAFLISGFSSVSSPGTFPMAASAVMVIAMASILLKNRRLKKTDTGSFKDEMRLAAKRVLPVIFLVYTTLVISYIILIQPLHFLPSSFIFLLLSMIYLKGSNLLKSFIISAATLGFIYVMFQFFFRVVLP